MFFILAASLFAQDKALLSADEYFAKRDYVRAARFYKKALRKSDNYKEQKKIAYQIALSYYNMNNYKSALEWFEDAAGDASANTDLFIYYSEALAIEGRYNEAISLLRKVKLKGKDSLLINRKIAGIELLSKQQYIDTLGITKSIENLNTEYSEYGIAYFKNKFVISSSRKEGMTGRMDGRTGQGFSNLFYTVYNKNEEDWAPLKKMSGKFNTNENEGSFSYDSINQTAYWTRCTEKTDLCLIYLSHFNSFNNKWTKPEKAPFQLPGFDYGHPFISSNGQTLFFTSNMSDGHGGKDIWKISRKNDGSWGIPVNLGDGINTEGNEAFPSIYGDTLLFFSSDRHSSLGRYDIFFSLREGLRYKQSANLGYPINSAADDYGILLDKSGKQGWFCSDRNLSTSDDIYSFKGFPIKIVIEGKVLHELDSSPITNASIVFMDMNGSPDSLKTNENGEYILYLNAFDNYRIRTSKEGYYTDYKSVDTRDKSILFSPPPQKTLNFHLSKTQYPCAIKGNITNKETTAPMGEVKVEIYNKAGFSNWAFSGPDGVYSFDGLKPNTIYTIRTSKDGYFSESRVCNLPKVDSAKIFRKENGYDMDFELMKIQMKSEIVLSNIYYDFNKSNLRETSKIELDKLASMLIETPAVVVQISAHTDEIGREAYNLKLSAARAQSVVDYLVMKGIDRKRLIAKGYGESRLLIKNARTDEEHQANRRTTFKVLEILGSKTAETADPAEENITNETNDKLVESDLIYRVQISSGSRQKDLSNSFTDVYKNISRVLIYENSNGNLFKYEVGNALSFSEAKILQQKLKNIGYTDCFVTAYYKGDKISVSEALRREGL
jgi:outer membrane protein OmpA-like peptidoglycan-associated protein/tetratricopeptide (TPR) repeat protein